MQFCKRIRETFLRANVLNEDISALCVLMSYFISDKKDNVTYIVESSLLQAMCAIINLPLEETKPPPPNHSSVHVGYFFALRGCLRGIMAVLMCVFRS